MSQRRLTIPALIGTLLVVAAGLAIAEGSDVAVGQLAKQDPASDRQVTSDARSSLEAFFAMVESGALERARGQFESSRGSSRGSSGQPADDGLKDLQQRLAERRHISSGTAADSATVYGSATRALAIIPFRNQDGNLEALCVRMAGEGGWVLLSREFVSPREALAELKAFRKEHPDAESMPHDDSLPLKHYESSLDLAAWEAATAQAIDYARRHPAKPEFARPPGLANLTQDDDLDEIVRQNEARLSHEDKQQRLDAQRNLRYLGPLATDVCIAALESEDKDTRRWAASTLDCSRTGTMSDDVLEALVSVIANDPEPTVRRAAVGSLFGLENARAVPVLTSHAVRDPDSSVCQVALNQLAYRRDPAAFAPLAQLLREDPNDPKRQVISRTMMEIDHRAAWPLIIEAAERVDSDHDLFSLLHCASQPPNHHTTAVQGWPKELDELHRLVRNTYTILGERYGPSEIRRILQHIDSDHSQVRAGCASALGYLRATETVPELLRLAEQPDKAPICLRTLMGMGTPEAVELVARSIRDADRQWRGWLVSKLGSAEAGGWAIPLLIVLLDDRGLLLEAAEPAAGMASSNSGSHRAHSALTSVCRRLGMEVAMLNLAGGNAGWDLHEEIRGLKAWWADYGEHFLRDKPVPPPTITDVFWISSLAGEARRSSAI